MEGEIYYDKKLTTSAIMIALAVVLAWVSKIIPAPWMQGGSITFASMVPIIIVSLMFDVKSGGSYPLSFTLSFRL